jgi:hypothetical protein
MAAFSDNNAREQERFNRELGIIQQDRADRGRPVTFAETFRRLYLRDPNKFERRRAQYRRLRDARGQQLQGQTLSGTGTARS